MGTCIPWPAAHSTALADCRAAGLSFSLAANAINEQFQTLYSRNAAIGRASRMQIGRVARPTAAKHRAPRAYVPREKFIQIVPKMAPEEISIRCAEVTPCHLSLVDLDPSQCRYPYGDGPFTFCGHEKIAGSSYCSAHFHLTRKGA